MEDFQSQYQEQIKQQEKKGSEIKHCKKCGATLSAEDKFCPECGEKIGGEEKTCRWCGFLTTKEICPECGKRVIPQICTKCGKETYFDVCEHCGQISNAEMQMMVEKKTEPVKQMSEEDAKAILREFEEAENAEVEYFKKKMHEHEILLAEKKFFDEREKRINDTFGTNSSAIKYPDPEETKFLQQAAEGMKKIALQKEQEAIQEALEKKFPGVKTPEEEHEEFLKLVKERDELFNKGVAENRERIDAEVAEIERKIEEQRRLEEEIAKERRRLEIEAFNNRICGTYINYNHGEEIRLIISLDENGTLHGKDLTIYDEKSTYDFAGIEYVAVFTIKNWEGNTFDFEETERRFIKNPNNKSIDDLLYKFWGRLNSDGTVINGHWINTNNTKSFSDYRKY